MKTHDRTAIVGLVALSVLLGGVDFALAADNTDAVVADARASVEKKDYARAIQLYSSIHESISGDPELMIEYARVYAYANRHKEAVATFERITTTFPSRAKQVSRELAQQRAYIELHSARADVKKKDYASASKRFDEIRKVFPDDVPLLIEHARIRAYMSDHQGAIDLFESAIRQDSSRKAGLMRELDDQYAFDDLNAAREFVEQMDYRSALDLYEGIGPWIEARNDAGLMIEWARIYTYASRHQSAINRFEVVRTKHPDRAAEIGTELKQQERYLKLASARSLVEQERYNEAIEEYERLLDVLKQDPGLLIERARVYSYAKREVEAAKLFEEVRQTHPAREADVLRELGDMYLWADQPEKALDIYRRKLKQEPGNLEAQVGEGRALAWMGREQEGLAVFDEILAKDARNVYALVEKADILSWLDRLEDSLELFDKALEIEPGNLKALNGRAKIFVWDGYHRRGIKSYREILAKYPESSDAMEGLAFGLYWDGRTPESARILRSLLARKPGSRKESIKLLHRINAARRPQLLGEVLYSDLSTGTRTMEYRGGAGKRWDNGLELTALAAESEIEDVSPGTGVTNAAINARRLLLGGKLRPTPWLRMSGTVNWTDYEETDWDVVLPKVRVAVLPTDPLKLEAGWDRDTKEDLDTIESRLTLDTWMAGATWRPDRRVMFGGTLKLSDYSDGNAMQSLLGVAEYRIRQEPYAKIYYNYYDAEWDRIDDTYFSLTRFQVHTLGLYVSERISKKWFAEAQFSAGYERQEKESSAEYFYNQYAGGGLVWQATESLAVKLGGKWFKSWPVEGDSLDEEYESLHAGAMVSWSFGPRSREELPGVREPVTTPSERSR